MIYDSVYEFKGNENLEIGHVKAGPISSTSEYRILLNNSKEELAQQVIVLRDLLRALRAQLRAAVESERSPEPCIRCGELEEELTEATATIMRFIEGASTEWDI